MTSKETLEIIADGENSYIEFKLQEIKAKDLAEEIIAFANSEGGTIFLGVNDDGEIVGVTERNVEEKIINICRNNCIPNVIPKVSEVVIYNRKIVIISIAKGSDKPYYTSEHNYYIRVGTTKRIASKEELLRLFEASGALHFDISPIKETTIKDLNLDVVNDYFLKYNSFAFLDENDENRKRILINADILKLTESGLNCSIGGLLIFGKQPDIKLPQNGVSFAHFDGNGITERLIDKKIIIGRLQDIADQLMVSLNNNIKVPSDINGFKREEKEDFPLVVLREAAVNALVHRNYSISGSRIRIFMFNDRIEFHSPGRLPNTVTIEKMKIGVSYSRNPFLVKYMENLRYIDQLGRGIPMIIMTMKDVGAKEPKLEESGEEFILTIYKNKW